MTKPESDFEKQIREAQERAQRSLNQSRADNAGKVDKNGKPIGNDGVMGALKGTGSAMRGLAGNIAVIAGFISAVQKTGKWIADTYRGVKAAVRSVPYVGPLLSATIGAVFGGVPRAIFKFTHPHEGEKLRQSTKNVMTYPFRKAFNVASNMVSKEKKEMPVNNAPRVLSTPRVGMVTLAAAWAVTGALNVPVVGDGFNWLVAEPPVDAFRMGTTAVANMLEGKGLSLNAERLHCGIPTKSDHRDDLLEVTCGHLDANGRFDEQTQTPFIARPGRILSDVYTWTHGHGPHDTHRVVGAIKPDATDCDITYYGTRFRIAKWANFKPEILNASCRPSNVVVSTPEAPKGP